MIIFKGETYELLRIHKVIKKYKKGNRIRLDNLLKKIKARDESFHIENQKFPKQVEELKSRTKY